MFINLVSEATKAAIKHAKYRGSTIVEPDDLLVGVLQTIARFDIARIGHLIIDLQEFDDFIIADTQKNQEEIKKRKVTYSSHVNELLEEAARIARDDHFGKVGVIHILAAFTGQDRGLMHRIKKKYGFSSKEWRIALSGWEPIKREREEILPMVTSSEEGKLYFSPDEAAQFLSVHVQTIRGYIRTGKLPALRLAGERALRIKREDLLALLEPFKA